MGLDCYVEDKNGEELWYGRKENEIHGWMQRKSGIYAYDFNCVKFKLTKEILHEFIKDVNEGNLVNTKGFFFGYENDVDYVKEVATNLFNSAYPLACNDEEVYYNSWW